MSEGTIKPLTKGHVNETIGGIDLNNEPFISPIENFDDNYDIIKELRTSAANNPADAEVSEVEFFGNIPYFNITCSDDTYTIFIYDNKICYRNFDSFKAVCDEIAKNISVPGMLLFDYDDNTAELDYFSISDIDDAKDLIDTLFLCSNMNENVKIKAPSLSCNGDLDDSKLYDDAMHGDKEQRDFEDKIEKETQLAGVDNPLAPMQPMQPESVQYTDGNELHESKKETDEKMKETYEYNIGDWVIIKENDMKAQVNNIIYNADGDITLFTIIASNGIAYDLDSLDEIEPDPLYMDNVPGRVINSLNLIVPKRAEFDIDPETRLTRISQNEKFPEDYHRDLNVNTVYVYVLKDGRKLCEQPYVANFEDIAKSKKIVRVIDESGNTKEYDVNKDLDFLDMPYAAVVDSDGKPVRSIQIDPKSYINAEETDLVICKVDGKITKFPKSRISILS